MRRFWMCATAIVGVASTSSPTRNPVTETPVTASPTSTPVTKSPVTTSPTRAPVTQTPLTAAPTSSPVTKTPSATPTNSPVTQTPVTSSPTAMPISASPTATPVTASPTKAPVTQTPLTAAPTSSPVTQTPSATPTSSPVTQTPITFSPTAIPITASPTATPVTASPTSSPVTQAPATASPTRTPTTASPTATTDAPTTAIVGSGYKLVAPDPGFDEIFGYSGQLAATGNDLVVGSPYDVDVENRKGSAIVFVRNASTWSQQAKLLASDGRTRDQFGWSVAIDGDYVIVGANTESKFEVGAAYIFARTGSTWVQQAKISPGSTTDVKVNGGYFGHSVDIGGNYAVIGAPFTSNNFGGNVGTAYVFVRSGTTWSPQATLMPTGVGSKFGYSVAIGGGYIVVGAYSDDTTGIDSGAVYIFVRVGGTDWLQQTKLAASDGSANDRFGWSVGIAGQHVVVGASGKSSGASADVGAAYVFVRNAKSWTQQAKVIASDGANSNQFGSSVAITPMYLIVGANAGDTISFQFTAGTGSSGSAYIYTKSGSTWAQKSKLVATDNPAHRDFFGDFVGISSGGEYAAVGVSGDDNNFSNEGSVYVFQTGFTPPTRSPTSSAPRIAEPTLRLFSGFLPTPKIYTRSPTSKSPTPRPTLRPTDNPVTTISPTISPTTSPTKTPNSVILSLTMGAGVDLENTTALETQISEDMALALGVPSTDFDVTFTTIDGMVVAEVLVIKSSLPKEEVAALTNMAFEGGKLTGVAAMRGTSDVYRVKCTLAQTGGNAVTVAEVTEEAWLNECPEVQYVMVERGPQFNVELTAGLAIAVVAVCICFFAFYYLLVSAKVEGDGGDNLAGGVLLFGGKDEEDQEGKEDETEE